MRKVLATVAFSLLGISPLYAAEFKISIGIRETGGSGPGFADAGTTGGIEWVDLDVQTLTADGTWQLFTFTPSFDPLTPFAGATANGILDTDWVSLEHVRILNSDGITSAVQLWIDDVTNTDSSGSFIQGFELFALNSEAVFQEPSFSGSTSGNLLPGSTALVSSSEAFSGAQSNEINFQFIDSLPTRWVRLTTFNTLNGPNPAMHAREIPGAPTISFYARAIVDDGPVTVPEPGTLALGVIGFGLCAWRKRRHTGGRRGNLAVPSEH